MRAGALRSVQPAGSERPRGSQMDCRPSQARRPKGEAMSRDLLAMLLLATGVALADQKPKDKPSEAAAEAQVQTASVQGETKEAQAGTPEAQGRSEAAEVKTEAALERAPAKTKSGQDHPEMQANTEEAPGRADSPQAQTDKDGKLISVPGGKALGMSVLGNQEAPTSLVIVPWKTSEVGSSLGISPMLDDSRQPVDKEVFMRELRYYEVRSEKKP